MSDILNPKDEQEAAEGRQVRPIKSSSADSQSQPSSSSAAPVEQPVTPTPPPAPQQAPVGEDLFGGIRPVHPSQFLEAQSGNIGALTDPTESTRMDVENFLGGLTPERVAQKLSAQSLYSQPDLTGNPDQTWERVNSTYEAAKKEYDRFVKEPVFGMPSQNYTVLPDGSVIPKTPATDTGIASRGLNSELGKHLQDNVDPEGKYNTQRTITQFLFEDAWNLLEKGAHGVATWTGLNRLERTLGIKTQAEQDVRRERINQEFQQTLAKLSDKNQGFNLASSDSTESIGDYGNAGMVSALIYGLNTIPSAVVGGVYDVADEIIRYRTGKDPYEGSRAADAIIKARDWGLSNRWSEQNYLSLQEPEDLEVGTMTGNWYWDAPEHLSKATGGVISPKYAHWIIQMPLAIAGEVVGDGIVDTALLRANSVIGKADLASKMDGYIPPTKTNLSGNSMRQELVEQATESNGVVVKAVDGQQPQLIVPPAKDDITTEVVHVEPKNRRLQFVTEDEYNRYALERQNTEIVPVEGNRSVMVVNLDGGQSQAIQVRPVPRLPRLDDVVAKPHDVVPYVNQAEVIVRPQPEALPSSVVSLHPRNNAQLTEVALNSADPSTGKGLLSPTFGGVLTDNEIRALRSSNPVALARYGTDVNPMLMNANTLALPDGSVLDIPNVRVPAEYMDDVNPVLLGQSPSDTLLDNYMNIQAEAARKRFKLVQDMNEGRLSPSTAKRILTDIQTLEAQGKVVLAQAVDRGEGYKLLSPALPDELLSSTDEAAEVGNQIAQSVLILEDQATTLVTLRTQVDNLADLTRKLDGHIDSLGRVGRQDISISEFTGDWSTDGGKLSLANGVDGGALQPFDPDLPTDTMYDHFDDVYEPEKMFGDTPDGYVYDPDTDGFLGVSVDLETGESVVHRIDAGRKPIDADWERRVDATGKEYYVSTDDSSELGEDFNFDDILSDENTINIGAEEGVIDPNGAVDVETREVPPEALAEADEVVEESVFARRGQGGKTVADMWAEAEKEAETLTEEVTEEVPSILSSEVMDEAVKQSSEAGGNTEFGLPDQSLNHNRGIKKGDIFLGEENGDPVVLMKDGTVKYVKTNMMGQSNYAAFIPKSPRHRKWLGIAEQYKLSQEAAENVTDTVQQVAKQVDESPMLGADIEVKPTESVQNTTESVIDTNFDSSVKPDDFRRYIVNFAADIARKEGVTNLDGFFDGLYKSGASGIDDVEAYIQANAPIKLEGKFGFSDVASDIRDYLDNGKSRANSSFDWDGYSKGGLPELTTEVQQATTPKKVVDPRRKLAPLSPDQGKTIFQRISSDFRKLGVEFKPMPDDMKAKYKGNVPKALFNKADNVVYFDFQGLAKARPEELVYHMRHESVHAMQNMGGMKALGIDIPDEFRNFVDSIYKGKVPDDHLPLEYEAFYLQENPELYEQVLKNKMQGVQAKPDVLVDEKALAAHREMMRKAAEAHKKFKPSADPAQAKPIGKVTPTKTKPVAKVEAEWFHGTRTSKKLPDVDPVVGGASAEFGKGVYLTQEPKLAEAAARKVQAVNKPSVADATFSAENSRVVRVDVRQYNEGNILDLSTVMTKKTSANPRGVAGFMNNTFVEAAKAATDDGSFASFYGFRIGGKQVATGWDEFRTAYAAFNGGKAPSEIIVAKFQAKVNELMRQKGITAGTFTGKDGSKTLVIYDPRKLVEVDEIPIKTTGDFMEGLENQRFLDQRTYDQMPDDVTLSNLKQSQKAQADWALQQNAEALADEQLRTVDEVDAYFDARRELQTQVVETKRRVIKNLEDSLPDVEAQKAAKQRAARYVNRNIEINPC
jgi:hypothetical protein